MLFNLFKRSNVENNTIVYLFHLNSIHVTPLVLLRRNMRVVITPMMGSIAYPHHDFHAEFKTVLRPGPLAQVRKQGVDILIYVSFTTATSFKA